MGYISNQWLNRGQGLRNRSYNPVAVTISCGKATDSWSERNEVKAEFTARRAGGQYQTLHLSETEADTVAGTFVAHMSRQARDKVLSMLLRELSHARLLRALAVELRTRVRLPKDR